MSREVVDLGRLNEIDEAARLREIGNIGVL
jgi:hypothetical protein